MQILVQTIDISSNLSKKGSTEKKSLGERDPMMIQ